MNNDELEFLRQSNYIENEPSSEAFEDAVKAWKYLIKKPKLNAGRILHAHQLLMKSRNIPERDKGNWRKQQVTVGGKDVKQWYALPELMENWMIMANGVYQVATSPSTVEDFIMNCHINFEKIHPFLDGNGRMGRILLNWQRVKIGLPILIITEEAKQEYYRLFE